MGLNIKKAQKGLRRIIFYYFLPEGEGAEDLDICPALGHCMSGQGDKLNEYFKNVNGTAGLLEIFMPI